MSVSNKGKTLSNRRNIIKQIMIGTCPEVPERIMDVIFDNIETQDKAFIKELKEEVRWRMLAMIQDEYTPYQTSRNLQKKIDELAGKELI